MKRLKTLIKKEIMDILRDKKTLIIMVVVPLLLYPTIMIGMSLIMSMVIQSQEEAVHTVAYEGSAADAEVVEALEALYAEHSEDLACELTFEQMKRNDEAQADVWLSVSAEEGENIKVEISYTSTNQDSNYAESAVTELLSYYKDDLLKEKLAGEGLTEEFLTPVEVESVDSASESESMGMSIGGSIGMMLIVTVLMGAFYPAVDVTTGEKERGTLETLLTLPVSNFQMIMSKYIAVALFACATAVLSLLALGGSVVFLMFAVSTELAAELQGISAATILSMVPVLLAAMVTVALLITAICMCFCVFAKSMKEANNYSTAVMLIIMFASMVGMIPTANLDYKTALIPIANTSLLIKQIAAQQFSFSLAAVTIAVNFAYSVIIIWILAKMYDSEDILFHDGFKNFQIFKKRSEFTKGTVPGTGDMIMSIVVLLLLVLYVGTAVTVRNPFGGVIVQQLLILAVPVVVVWYMKSDYKKLFSLQKPKKGTVLAGICLYVGAFSLEMALVGILTKLLPASAENVTASFEVLMDQPTILIVLVMALMPAVGEEIFFRGFLYGGLKHKYDVKWAVLISAIIFGAFHMSLVKLIPTAMLGACFAYIVYKSGSIYIGMTLHFINNAFLMLQMKEPDTFGKILPVLMKEEYAPLDMAGFVAVGVIGLAAGIVLMKKAENRKMQ
ncbi:MAG: CPBP family intramembrane metalloprotease [Lachnospiraceae bacterium]|nr:CPBP family intramembrane metalloprotease [Lachnospiraceae bacterium]